MLNSFKLLLILININSETLVKPFQTVNQSSIIFQSFPSYVNSLILVNLSSDSPFELWVKTFNLKSIIETFWQQIQNGLTLNDIENVIFFLVLFRFIILIVRYNLKTSLYITLIGLCAGYLWYRHLIDITLMYRQMLIKIPYLQNFGASAIALEANSQSILSTEAKVGSDVHWYNPGKLLYYAFVKGIIQTDSETGIQYYIDPISMIISNLDETSKIKILPIYYKIYNTIIPRFFETVSEFWNQLSGIAAYAMITRIGKRYCPYLIRWHWTFLLIIGFVEQILIYFLYRLMYFQEVIIQEKLVIAAANNYPASNLILQFNMLTGVLTFCILLHLGSIFFGLFHAICGQYFYFPFLVENTELHIGPRPKNSIYSGGQTAWQDEKQNNSQRRNFKIWYGWFGSGTNKIWIFSLFKQLVGDNIKKLFQQFRK
jgi:hypothetical protein